MPAASSQRTAHESPVMAALECRSLAVALAWPAWQWRLRTAARPARPQAADGPGLARRAGRPLPLASLDSESRAATT